MTDYADGMRRATEIAKGKAWPVGLTMHPHLHGPVAAAQHDMAIEIADAILAAIPAPAPWTPPEDRPEGFECLGRGVKGSSWHHIQWNNGRWWLRSPGIQAFGLVAFAPLPPSPEAQP